LLELPEPIEPLVPPQHPASFSVKLLFIKEKGNVSLAFLQQAVI